MSKEKREEKCDQSKDLQVPEDRYYVVYILFFLLGLVHILPWSFFTTATEFWMYKFRNTSSNETDGEYRTDLQAEFNASLNIVLQISEVAFLIIGILFGQLIKPRVRMIGIFSIIFVLFAIITAFIKIDTDSWQDGFFALIMVIVAGINSMNAVFTITIYTTMSYFPQHYLAPYLTGGGLSKVFTSGLQILSLASGLSIQDSAVLYFSVGLFTIGAALAILISTGQNRFYLYHMSKHSENGKEKRVGFEEGIRLTKKLWAQVVMYGFYIIVNNASPIALVVSENEGKGAWNDVFFIPTISYLLAAVCDLVGRGIAFRWAPNVKPIFWAMFSVIRTLVFLPLLMLCNAQPRNHLPVLLPHDYQYIICIIGYWVTGGYLISRSSYNIAHLVTKEELKNAYHVNMLFAGLNMGIFSFLSIVSVKLL